METFQPRIDAYPFQENHGVLQLASGNVGIGNTHIIDGGYESQIKPERSVSGLENSDPHSLRRIEEHQRQKPRRPLAVPGRTWFAGFRDGHWQWDRCEWETERYAEYRVNQRKKFESGKPQKDDQVWTDEKEELFQYGMPPLSLNDYPAEVVALRCGERLGRRKAKHDTAEDKLCGRNEIIAFFIEEQLPGAMAVFDKHGKPVNPRKQISSHIQTLKNMMKNENPLCMSALYLSKGETVDFSSSGMSLVIDPPKCQRAPPPPLDLTYGYPRPRRFTITRQNPSRSTSHCRKNTILPPPPGVLGSNGIHRVNLEFCVNRRRQSERMHTYTRIQCETGAAPRCLDEIPDWQHFFPQLAYYHDQRCFTGELVHCDASLDLAIEYPANSELAMITDIVVKEGIKYRDWTSKTYMYEQGNPVDSERNGIRMDGNLRPLNYETSRKVNETTIAFKHNTKWWAYNVFAEVHRRVWQARDDPQATRIATEWGRGFVKNWSMIQEVWARPSGIGTELQRVATFLWNFQCARIGEAATTVWRKITPPSPRTTVSPRVQSPEDNGSYVGVTSDAGINDIFPAQRGSYDGPFARGGHSQGLLMMQPSNISSCSETPGPEYESSFPSSTTDSFPSSVSSLDPSLSSFHQASLDTRDLTYLAEVSSFHAQVSGQFGGMGKAQHASFCADYAGPQSNFPQPSTMDDYSQQSLVCDSKESAQHVANTDEALRQYNKGAPHNQSVQHDHGIQQLSLHTVATSQPQGNTVCADTDIVSPAYDYTLTTQLTNMLQRHEVVYDLQHSSDHDAQIDYDQYDAVDPEDHQGYSQMINDTRGAQPDTEGITADHNPLTLHALSTSDEHPYPNQDYQSYLTPHEPAASHTDHAENDDGLCYGQASTYHQCSNPSFEDQSRVNDDSLDVEDATIQLIASYDHDVPDTIPSSTGSSFEIVPEEVLDRTAHSNADYIMITDNESTIDYQHANVANTGTIVSHWVPEQWTAIEQLDEVQIMEYAAMMKGHIMAGDEEYIIEGMHREGVTEVREGEGDEHHGMVLEEVE